MRQFTDRFFRLFERHVDPLGRPDPGPPPAGGIGFIRHYVRQMPGPFVAMLTLGGLTALIETALFVFVGWLVDMMNASGPASFWADHGTTLMAMALLVGVVRVAVAILTAVVEEQIVVPDFFSMVRWQGHLAVSKQDVSFFDDQLAGRVSSKVWQAGQAAGDVLVSLLQIIWFIVVFALTTLVVIAALDWRMLLPVVFWLGVFAILAYTFVPRIRDEARRLAEVTAVTTGRMVDGYSNIRTVKLYASEETLDNTVRAGFENTLVQAMRFTRIISGMRISYQTFSSLMLVIIASLALHLFVEGQLSAGSVAVVLALCLRLNLLLGRLLGLLNGLFRNFGTVQNSAELVSQRPVVVDVPKPDALPAPLLGDVKFTDVAFAYTGSNAVLTDFNLHVRPGEKLGIVGRSGVGKTTLVNLLLRFHDVEAGVITLDGVNIAKVPQKELRQTLGIVTQDTAMLHRSVRDNIVLGRPGASDGEIKAAARRASAHDFIVGLSDSKGNQGYDTLMGERGVRLSGGQRQRIALARVFLKDAPVLLLDEATSALDSEAEAVIQDNLEALMEGKTVIAIAHRLSTIAHLDRLVVMDESGIVEEGTHQSLLEMGGTYAGLWERQSGGFLARGE
ncbi:MAG: ABC transporter ATP-binding protein [Pseudomonadota bacterium]